MTVVHEWRGRFDNKALNALHAEGFNHEPSQYDWWDQVNRHSLAIPPMDDESGIRVLGREPHRRSADHPDLTDCDDAGGELLDALGPMFERIR
ncbi:hypothetical protein [Nonomuraea sp. LPB2021202275-12-8]|uniref:hypothetical protein n=1 Tax=Nonomuraea sp. LPB2021202275-12-8 TaxID=3120159 RepID=UPI00300CFDC2